MSFHKKNLSNALGALVPYKERTWPITYIFEDMNIIGRNDQALLCIRDPQVSRIHTIIERKENKFTICDKSARGTFVNGKPLPKEKVVDLLHNDVICFSPVERFSYTFRLNKKIFPDPNEDENLNSLNTVKGPISNSAIIQEMEKLHDEIKKYQKETSGFQGEMNQRLIVQENSFQEERMNLSRLISATNEQKEMTERKLLKMEKINNEESNKLKDEVEVMMEELNKKGLELQQLKEEMELRQQREREELEERCRAEVEELREKLAESEMEQGRLQGETREVEKKLEETKITLEKCELEQQRIIEEKVNVETTLGSEIETLTNERSTVTKEMKKLKQLLQEADDLKKRGIQALEEQLQCSICVELFFKPTVLNCGHIFCKACIDEWKRKKKICPMCRTKISSSTRIFHLDTIIDANVGLLSEESRKRRDELINLRAQGKCPLPAKKRKHALLPATSTSVDGQGSAQTSADEVPAHSSAQSSTHSLAQSTSHSPAQSPTHSSAQSSARISARSFAHSPGLNVYPFNRVQSAPNSFGDNLHLISMAAPSNLDDPFTWNQHGRQLRPRPATSLDQVLDLTHVMGPPVTVAAIDLTHLDWPQPSASNTHPSPPPSPTSTIDLTTP